MEREDGSKHPSIFPISPETVHEVFNAMNNTVLDFVRCQIETYPISQLIKAKTTKFEGKFQGFRAGYLAAALIAFCLVQKQAHKKNISWPLLYITEEEIQKFLDEQDKQLDGKSDEEAVAELKRMLLKAEPATNYLIYLSEKHTEDNPGERMGYIHGLFDFITICKQ